MLPIRRAGEATCPDCRAVIDPDGPASAGPYWTPDGWRPTPNPVTAWRALRDAVAERGMPPDVLPPEPVPAETRPDPLLSVVHP